MKQNRKKKKLRIEKNDFELIAGFSTVVTADFDIEGGLFCQCRSTVISLDFVLI